MSRLNQVERSLGPRELAYDKRKPYSAEISWITIICQSKGIIHKYPVCPSTQSSKSIFNKLLISTPQQACGNAHQLIAWKKMRDRLGGGVNSFGGLTQLRPDLHSAENGTPSYLWAVKEQHKFRQFHILLKSLCLVDGPGKAVNEELLVAALLHGLPQQAYSDLCGN